jgi:hypothetical protein
MAKPHLMGGPLAGKKTIAACVLVTLALVAWTHRHRLRHLAVPV